MRIAACRVLMERLLLCPNSGSFNGAMCLKSHGRGVAEEKAHEGRRGRERGTPITPTPSLEDRGLLRGRSLGGDTLGAGLTPGGRGGERQGPLTGLWPARGGGQPGRRALARRVSPLAAERVRSRRGFWQGPAPIPGTARVEAAWSRGRSCSEGPGKPPFSPPILTDSARPPAGRPPGASQRAEEPPLLRLTPADRWFHPRSLTAPLDYMSRRPAGRAEDGHRGGPSAAGRRWLPHGLPGGREAALSAAACPSGAEPLGGKGRWRRWSRSRAAGGR